MGIRKGEDGRITHIKANNGSVYTIAEAQHMARNGEVDSLTDVHPDGTWEIQNTAYDNGYAEENNLDQLPQF